MMVVVVVVVVVVVMVVVVVVVVGLWAIHQVCGRHRRGEARQLARTTCRLCYHISQGKWHCVDILLVFVVFVDVIFHYCECYCQCFFQCLLSCVCRVMWSSALDQQPFMYCAYHTHIILSHSLIYTYIFVYIVLAVWLYHHITSSCVVLLPDRQIFQ